VNEEKQQVTDEVLTPANIITAIRLALLPVFMVLLIGYSNNVAAFIVLLIAALTDLIDGQLARFTNTVSELGTLLDPFVDRYFIFSAVLGVFTVGRLPLWLFIAFFSRDFVLLLFNVFLRMHKQPVFKVVFLGKLATAAVMAAFCSIVLLWPTIPGLGWIERSWLPGLGDASAPLGYALLYLGMIFSWLSAVYYIYRGLAQIVQAKRNGSGVSSVANASGTSSDAEVTKTKSSEDS
jgi:cardiolipin synthase